MRNLMISAALLATVAAAAPAAAQYQDYGRGNYGYNQGQNINQQLRNLSQRIDRAYQRRLVSPREANRLQGEVQQIDRLYDRYRRNGVSQREHFALQDRIQRVRQQIRWERQEGREDRWDDRRDDRRNGRF